MATSHPCILCYAPAWGSHDMCATCRRTDFTPTGWNRNGNILVASFAPCLGRLERPDGTGGKCRRHAFCGDPAADPIPDPRAAVSGERFDEVRIQRRLEGVRVRLNQHEAAELVRRCLAKGWSANKISRVCKLRADRYLPDSSREDDVA